MTTRSGRIAVEATEVHWGVGSKGGSPTRQKEEAAIRAGVVRTFSAKADPIPAIVRAIESKCGKRYSVDGDNLWFLLLGGSPAAPASTFIFTPSSTSLDSATGRTSNSPAQRSPGATSSVNWPSAAKRSTDGVERLRGSRFPEAVRGSCMGVRCIDSGVAMIAAQLRVNALPPEDRHDDWPQITSLEEREGD